MPVASEDEAEDDAVEPDCEGTLDRSAEPLLEPLSAAADETPVEPVAPPPIGDVSRAVGSVDVVSSPDTPPAVLSPPAAPVAEAPTAETSAAPVAETPAAAVPAAAMPVASATDTPLAIAPAPVAVTPVPTPAAPEAESGTLTVAGPAVPIAGVLSGESRTKPLSPARAEAANEEKRIAVGRLEPNVAISVAILLCNN